MSSRLLCAAALCLGVVTAFAADLPQNSPFGQAGAPAGSTARAGTLQFAGVSTLGNQTIISLYNPGDKSSSWVQVGTTSDGVTVVSYDSHHDQVTIRQNGVEKVLPLQPPVAVVSGPATAVPVVAPIQPAPATNTPAMSAAPVASEASPAAPTGTASTSLSRARQEEEARMLVSDLLEIGMAQRRAYEEAKRKQAEQAAQSGQQPAPVQPAPQPSAPAATGTGS